MGRRGRTGKVKSSWPFFVGNFGVSFVEPDSGRKLKLATHSVRCAFSGSSAPSVAEGCKPEEHGATEGTENTEKQLDKASDKVSDKGISKLRRDHPNSRDASVGKPR